MAYNKTCDVCGKKFAAKFPHQRRCSADCIHVAALRRARKKDQSLTVEQWKTRVRYCKWCGKKFQLQHGHNGRRYCSDLCSDNAIRESAEKFLARNPGKQKEYNDTRRRKRGRDTLMARLRRRYSDLPESCEACGESRVLDLAHKPAHARKGAHRTLRQYQRAAFWILCPTCHALVDRGVCTPDQLGLG